MRGSLRLTLGVAAAAVMFFIVAFAGRPTAVSGSPGRTTGRDAQNQDPVQHGRFLVLSHACADCHGSPTPSAAGWLAGMMFPFQEFKVGPCAAPPNDACFVTRPRNLTPDNATGLGRFSERQIFNALRYGLRPGETPDVEITSSIPGQGNFPAHPRYLAPPMPWPSWRFMPDQDLWAIAAYLKRGVKAVNHKVEDSEGPPDFWASAYTVEAIGPYPAPAFPTANELAAH